MKYGVNIVIEMFMFKINIKNILYKYKINKKTL